MRADAGMLEFCAPEPQALSDKPNNTQETAVSLDSMYFMNEDTLLQPVSGEATPLDCEVSV